MQGHKGADMNVLGVALLTFSITSEIAPQFLAGSERADFIRGSVASCMRGKVNHATLNRLPDVLVFHYCQCYSEGVANTVPVTEIRKERSAAADAAVEREGRRCFDAMKAEGMQLQKSRKPMK
jgi:hypothetical protein